MLAVGGPEPLRDERSSVAPSASARDLVEDPLGAVVVRTIFWSSSIEMIASAEMERSGEARLRELQGVFASLSLPDVLELDDAVERRPFRAAQDRCAHHDRDDLPSLRTYRFSSW